MKSLRDFIIKQGGFFFFSDAQPEVFKCPVQKCIARNEAKFPSFGNFCYHWMVTHDPATQFYSCTFCSTVLTHREVYVSHLLSVSITAVFRLN